MERRAPDGLCGFICGKHSFTRFKRRFIKYSYESHYRVTNVSRMMAVCFTAQRQVSLVAAVTRARIPRNKRRIGQLYNYTFVVEEDRGVRDLFIRFLWDLLLNVVINISDTVMRFI